MRHEVVSSGELTALFWERVETRGEDDCWIWTAGLACRRGYGAFSHAGRSYRAHRFALTTRTGPPASPSLLACHTCDNPRCCNPKHLFWGTHKDNAQDCVAKARHTNLRKTHCAHGHPFAGDNLVVAKTGYRLCRICQRATNERHKQKRKARKPA
jgi:hypothetical protein